MKLLKITKVETNKADTISFLFERNRFSYIKQEGKENFEKLTFPLDGLDVISKLNKILNSLDSDKFFEQKYKFLDISVLNTEFTLIPLDYFEENNAETFLNYNTPFSKNKGLRFNLIPQFNIAVVFYYQEELENVLVESSDKLRITHTAFKFLNKIDKKDGIYINLYYRDMEVAVVKNEQLLLYNIYPYQTPTDIKYFLKLIEKNLKINLSDFPLFLFGETDKGLIDITSLEFKAIELGCPIEFERLNFTTLDLL